MSAGQAGDLVAGRYRLQSVRGRGGMGVVWLARDELLHRAVAVKEIVGPPDLPADERDTLRQRALREARTAARLDHPNIVRVFDVVEHDDRPWIVMQLVPYRSLGDLIRETGPVTPQQAARLGLHILAAITAAHAAGILHRDVKPGNILLGPDDQVVLTDFGLAVADGSTRVTTSGLVIGSPAYMSPERARGEQATIAADLWSLGATLYAAVEGRDPFERDGTLAVLTAIATDEPDRPERAGALWPVISELLNKNPAARPRAVQVEPELRRIAGGPRSGQSALPEHLTVPLTPAQLVAAERSPALPRRQAADTPRHAPDMQRHAPDTQRLLAAGLVAATADGRAPTAAPAQPPLIPGLRPHPGTPAEPPDASAPTVLRRGRRPWVAAAVVGGLLALAGLALGLAYFSGVSGSHGTAAGHHRASGAPARHTQTAAPAQRHSTSPSAAPSSPAPPARAPSTAGFAAYHDPSGFSVDRPAGWQVSHSGHLVYIQPAGGGPFLLIDQTTHPQPNALADWRQQEAARISTYPGYHRVRLAPVQYAQAEQAADWEFTYYKNGQLLHVLNRNVLVNDHQAYALYWSVPEAQWASDYHYFRVFAATFRPASPPA